MATKTSQRIGIWIIAIVMSVGTLGAFFLPILINNNQTAESAQLQKALDAQKSQQATVPEPLDGYAAAPFDAGSVTDLKADVIKEGDGTAATANSTLTASYFGWTADGKIFDSSKKGGTNTPIPFNLQGVIKGWTNGLVGAKPGSVYKLTIPTDQAYTATDDGTGHPVGPLQFIVEVTDVK